MRSYQGLLFALCVLLLVKAGFVAVRFYDERAIVAKRKGWSFADFVSHLNTEQLYPSETACIIVYYGIGWMRTFYREFPVRPDDNLRVVYGISWSKNYNVGEFVGEFVEDLMYVMVYNLDVKNYTPKSIEAIQQAIDEFESYALVKDLVLLVDKLLKDGQVV